VALEPYLEAWLRLSLTPGVSHQALRQLLAAFGGPEQVLAADARSLGRVVPETTVRALSVPVPNERLARAAQWLEQAGNYVVTLADDTYPQALLNTPDPPAVFYVSGRVDLLGAPSLAIVGSRNATAQGIEHAEAFARALSDAGLTIVSGLALGIDAAAHRGGLAGSASSIAVIGTGADIVYPARNRQLAEALARDGCVVSEFPLGTAPVASNFPRRNRIISGLARGCLVVEAALLSGSLITARLANEQGKDVFAIPGSIHSPLAKGCHALIKQGAKLVETAQDILDELKLPRISVPPAIGSTLHQSEDALLAQVGFDPCDFDTLAQRTGVSAEKLAVLLTEWELEGSIQVLPGGRYQRLR
jgi:DNA processing protein